MHRHVGVPIEEIVVSLYLITRGGLRVETILNNEWSVEIAEFVNASIITYKIT